MGNGELKHSGTVPAQERLCEFAHAILRLVEIPAGAQADNVRCKSSAAAAGHRMADESAQGRWNPFKRADLVRDRRVIDITAEQFITAIGRKRYLDLGARQPCDQHGWDGGRVAERFVEKVAPAFDRALRFIHCQAFGSMVRPEMRRDRLRPLRLVVGCFRESDGIRARIGSEPTRDNGRHQRRVDTAGEKNADRHVGNQAIRACAFQQPGQMLLGRVFIPRNVDLGRRRFERPIAARAQAFGGRVAGPRARLDDAHRSEDRAIAGDISKLKELTERTVVEFARPRAKWLQTAELRCKCEDSLVEKKIERFDSGAIPNQQKTLLDPIPDRESEHPDKAFDRCNPPERIRFQHDLRVARAPELNAARRELGSNFLEVIYFTIEYGRETTVRRDHRLVSGGTQVDDRQPAMAEAERRRIAHVLPRAVVIRPPMREVLQPKIERPGKLAQSGAWTIVADYSAHLARLPESHCGRFD